MIKTNHVDFVIDEEYLFVALDEKIHKQAPKSWKTGNGEVHFDCSFSCLTFLKCTKSFFIFFYLKFVKKKDFVFIQGLDERGQPILTVYFRVHFYVDQFVLLR